MIGGMIDDYAQARRITSSISRSDRPGMLRDAIASGKPADLIIASAPLMARAREDRKDRARQPRRSRPGRARRRGPRGRARARHLDTRRREAGAAQGQRRSPTPIPSSARTSVDAPDEDRRELRHQGRGDPQGRALHRRQRRRREGRRTARPRSPSCRSATSTPRTPGSRDRCPSRSSSGRSMRRRSRRAAPSRTHARAFVAALTAPAMRERWLKAGWQPTSYNDAPRCAPCRGFEVA